MQIFVKDEKTSTYKVEPSTTVEELMYLISIGPTKFPTCRMILTYSCYHINGQQSKTMRELRITEESTLFLSYRFGTCRGCGPCTCGCEDGILRNKNPQDSNN